MGVKFSKIYHKVNILGKVGFWGSICSIIGVFFIFFPSNNAINEPNSNKINGAENIQIQGNNNTIIYENKRKEVKKIKDQSLLTTKEFNFIKYFGLYTGSYWVYNVGGLVQNTEQKNDIKKSSYKLSVLLVDNNQKFSSGIVVLLIEGNNPYNFCQGGRIYYIYNKIHVFDVCDYDKAKNIYKKIYSSKDYKIKDIKGANLLYKIPFKVNDVWLWNEYYDADDDERVKNNIAWYTYRVSKKIDKMDTPIGEFKNCNEISYDTASSSEQSYVCEGVGLISRVFEHSGSVEIENIQLIEFSINKF